MDPILEAADQALIRAQARQRDIIPHSDRRQLLMHQLNAPAVEKPLEEGHSMLRVGEAWLDRHVLFGRYLAQPSLFFLERATREAGEDPNYDPMQDPLVTSQPPRLQRLYIASKSRAESLLIKREQDNKEENQYILQTNPWKSIGAAFATLPLDPATYLDILFTKGAAGTASKLSKISKLMRAIDEARTARPFITGATGVGLSVAASETIAEYGLHQFQPNRGLDESTQNVLFAAAFGGLVGGFANTFSQAHKAKAMRELAKEKMTSDLATEIAVEAKRLGVKTEDQYHSVMKAVLNKKFGTDAVRVTGGVIDILPKWLSPFIRGATSEFEAERILTMALSGVAANRRNVPDALIQDALENVHRTYVGDAHALQATWKQILRKTGLGVDDQHRYLADTIRNGGEVPESVARLLPDATAKKLAKAAKEVMKFTDEIDRLMKRAGLTEELGNVKRIKDKGYFTKNWHKPSLNDEVRREALVEGLIKYQRSLGDDLPREEAEKIVDALAADTGGGFTTRILYTPEKGRSLEQVVDLPSTFEWSHNGLNYKTSDFLNNNVDEMIDNLVHGLLPRLLLANRFRTSQHRLLDEAVDRVNDTIKRLGAKAETGSLTQEDVAEIEALRRFVRNADIRVALDTSSNEADKELLGEFVRLVPVLEKAEEKLARGTRTLNEEREAVRSLHRRILDHDNALNNAAKRLPPNVEEAISREVELDVSANPRTKRIAKAEAEVRDLERKIKGSKAKLASSSKEETRLEKAIEKAEEGLERLRNRLSDQDAAPLLPQESAELVEESLSLGGKINEISTELASLGRRRGRVDKAIADRAFLAEIYGDFQGKDRLAEARKELKRIEARTAELTAERTKLQKKSDQISKKLQRGTHPKMGGPKRMETIGEEMALSRRLADMQEKLKAQRLRTADIEMRVLARQENSLPRLQKRLKEARANKLKPTEITEIRRRIRAQVVAGRRAGRAQTLFNEAAKKDPKYAKRRQVVREGLSSFSVRKQLGEEYATRRDKAINMARSLKSTKAEARSYRIRVNRIARRAKDIGRTKIPKSKVGKELPRPDKQAKWFEREMRSVSYALRNARRAAAKDAESAKTLMMSTPDSKARKRMTKNMLKFKGLPLVSQDPSGFMAVAGPLIKSITSSRLLGNMMIGSLSDTLTSILTTGSGAWLRGIEATFRKPIQTIFSPSSNKDEAVRMISILETVAGANRLEAFSGFSDGVGEIVGETGRVARISHGLHRVSRKVFGMDWWNSRTKMVAAMGSIDDMFTAFEKGKISQAQRVRWRANGLNDKKVEAIRKQWKAHAKKDKGGWYALTETWDDREAARSFRAYLTGVANSAVVTPGVYDLPYAFSSPVGSILLQFRSFGVSVVNRVMAGGTSIASASGARGLLEWNAVFVIGSYAIGYMIALLKSILRGEPDKEVSVLDAIEQSGVFGTIGEVVSASVDLLTSRGNRDPRGTFKPPAASTIEVAGQFLEAAPRLARGEGTATDISTIRRAAPWQNTFWISALSELLLDSALYGEAAEGRKFERNFGRYTLGLPDTRGSGRPEMGY